MASKNEEYIAVVSVLIALAILSIFFGVLWSFLLVFTFLLLAYLFGRPQTKRKIVTKKFKIKDDLIDNSLNDSEYVSPGKEMDVPFTGLPSPKYHKQSLRSPMPLLSLSSFATVTKRLSFNTSTLSPRDGLMFGNRSQRFNTTLGSPPRQSPMSPIKSPQTPKYFSLINPALNQPSTVKIATPEVNTNTLTINKSQKLTDSPLNRATILSALKQSTIRKRSVLEDEDSIDDASSPIQNHKKKRRYHYPIVNDDSKPTPRDDSPDLEVTRDIISDPPAVTRKSSGIYSLIQTRLKRKPLHDDGCIITTEERGVVKRTRQDYDKPARPLQVIENSESGYQGNEIATREEQNTTLTATISSGSKRVNANNNYDDVDDDDNDSGCDADDDDDIVMKTVPAARGAERLSKKQALKLAEQNKEKRKRTEMKTASSPPHSPEKTVSTGKQSSTPNHTPDLMVSRQQRISKKQRFLNTPTVSEVTTSATDSPVSEKSEISGQEMSPKKRFTVVRFPSKKDESKRRPVPVYCASINSPDVPKRRPVTHTITKEDIELDRKLAWQRVQSLLDGSDEDEEEKSKGASPSVAIHVTTCIPSPSKSQTRTVATTSGILSSSSAVSDGCKENQETVAVTTTPPTTTIQPITIAPNIASTQPSTPLSTESANKPNGITIQPTLLKQSESSSTPLTGTTETKPTMLLKGAITTSSEAALSIGQPSLTSTSLTPNTQGFSFNPASIVNTMSTVAVTQVDAPSGVSAALTSAPFKSLFRASTSQAFNPKSLTSLTTSSQSIQNPICTPVVQASLGSKIINTIPSVCAAPASFSINFASTTSIPPKVGVGSSNSPRVGANTSNNPPQAGFNTSSNPLQVGFSIPSSLPKSTSSTSSSGPAAATISSSLFSGFNASSTGSALQNTPNITTQQSQAGFSSPGGFSFSGSTVPKTTTQASTFSFGANQQTVAPNAFGSQTSQSMFAAGTVSAQTTLTTNPGSTQNAFGSSLTSTGKPFGSSNPANLFGAPSTTTAATSTPAFGLTSTNSNAFGNTGSAGSPGGFKFGGNTASTNVFGNATQLTTVSSAPSGQFSFGSSNAPVSQIKPGFSFTAGANSSSSSPAFGTAASSQGTFGAGTTKNVFGATFTPTPFGPSASLNVFGSPATNVPVTQTSQNAFGGLTNQNAFGSPATQNVLRNPPGTGGTGGFSFGGAASSTPSTGGFKFGAGGSNGFQSTPSSAPTFGTTTSAPQPPAGGFNFSAGGTTNTPAFGAATVNPGGFKFGTVAQTPSSAVAKPRPKITATRRRARK